MTVIDTTELAQSLKAAAVRAKTATEEYASGHMSVSVCYAECEEFNRLTDGPDNIITLVEALEKAQQLETQAAEMAIQISKRLAEAYKRVTELEFRAVTFQSAPVVPEIDRKAIVDKVYGKCCRMPGATFYNAAEFAIDEIEACLAAMLQAGNSPVIGIDPASGPDRTVEVRYVAPPGYVMVPKEPTESMINAWLSEVANWRGHIAGYKAMLAAAPQETLVNDVTTGKSLTITLPDTSSKAFWSGSGKTEVFHPETYKRWAKQAIERDCTIANIDVKVK